jgi:DNA topoisomerase-3
MEGISSLTKGLVAAHSAPVPEYAALFATASGAGTAGQQQGDAIGLCPRCKASVLVKPKGGGRMPDYFCSNRACKFAMWKDNRFFEAKKKKLDKKTAAALLTEGRVFFSDLYSEKTGKTYAATILLEDTGDRVNFRMEFGGGK